MIKDQKECLRCGVPDEEWIFRDPNDMLRWQFRELGDRAPWYPSKIEYTAIGRSNYCVPCLKTIKRERDEKRGKHED